MVSSSARVTLLRGVASGASEGLRSPIIGAAAGLATAGSVTAVLDALASVGPAGASVGFGVFALARAAFAGFAFFSAGLMSSGGRGGGSFARDVCAKAGPANAKTANVRTAARTPSPNADIVPAIPYTRTGQPCGRNPAISGRVKGGKNTAGG